ERREGRKQDGSGAGTKRRATLRRHPLRSVRVARAGRDQSKELSVMRFVTAVMIVACVSTAAPARAQMIQLALIARSEGRPDRDATASALYDEVRKGLVALADVEIVPSDGSRRIVWIIGGAAAGQSAAPRMVTGRYDRRTRWGLGIEADDMALRMMALQIAADHQFFTGKSAQDLARRIVTAIDTGALARVRKLPPKP